MRVSKMSLQPLFVKMRNCPGISSPGALDLLKLMALAAMLVDHINTLFLHPPAPELYALGRTAFPLFVLVWAINAGQRPERLQRRANRLWGWALLTQPVFVFAFREQQPWYALNILFVFAAATQLLALRHRYGLPGVIAGTGLLALLVLPLMPASYGIQGIVLSLSLATFFTARTGRMQVLSAAAAVISLIILNGSAHLLSRPLDTLTVAVLPTLVLPVAAVITAGSLQPAGSPRFLPGRFFYVMYVLHLLVLGCFV